MCLPVPAVPGLPSGGMLGLACTQKVNLWEREDSRGSDLVVPTLFITFYMPIRKSSFSQLLVITDVEAGQHVLYPAALCTIGAADSSQNKW